METREQKIKEQKIDRYERAIGQIKVDLMKLEEDKKFLKKRLKQLEQELKELQNGNKNEV